MTKKSAFPMLGSTISSIVQKILSKQLASSAINLRTVKKRLGKSRAGPGELAEEITASSKLFSKTKAQPWIITFTLPTQN